jgi:transposase
VQESTKFDGLYPLAHLTEVRASAQYYQGPNRCRVVEVTHSWFNRFRKLLVRHEKLTETYEALLHMAAAIIAFRKTGIIYG